MNYLCLQSKSIHVSAVNIKHRLIWYVCTTWTGYSFCRLMLYVIQILPSSLPLCCTLGPPQLKKTYCFYCENCLETQFFQLHVSQNIRTLSCKTWFNMKDFYALRGRSQLPFLCSIDPFCYLYLDCFTGEGDIFLLHNSGPNHNFQGTVMYCCCCQTTCISSHLCMHECRRAIFIWLVLYLRRLLNHIMDPWISHVSLDWAWFTEISTVWDTTKASMWFHSRLHSSLHHCPVELCCFCEEPIYITYW